MPVPVDTPTPPVPAVPTRRSGAWRWVWIPLVVFVLGRLVSSVFLVALAGSQGPLPQDAVGVHVWHALPGDAHYAEMLTNWDGQWYWQIAEEGYPDALEREQGEVVRNAYGFLPLYPWLVRGLMALTGLEFPLAAGLVSLLSAGLASVLLFATIRRTGGAFVAFAVVLALSTFPSSPILQVAYPEALTLLLLAGVFALLARRRYLTTALVVLVLGLCRPLSTPLLALFLLHALRRWRAREVEALSPGDRWRMAVLLGATALSALVWPLLVWRMAGEPRAYWDTMQSWSSRTEVGPGIGWLATSLRDPGVAVMVALIVLAVALGVGRRAGRALGPDLRAWSWLYVGFILVIATPSAGILRYLLLAIGPLPLILDRHDATAPRADRVMRVAALVVITALFLVGQWFWIRHVYLVDLAVEDHTFP